MCRHRERTQPWSSSPPSYSPARSATSPALPARGSSLYLLAWAVIFPVQTVAVYADTEPAGNDWQYFVVNAFILAFGLALNRLGARFAARRAVA